MATKKKKEVEVTSAVPNEEEAIVSDSEKVDTSDDIKKEELSEEPEDSEFNELVLEYEGDIKGALFEYCFKHNIVYDGKAIDELLNMDEFLKSKNRTDMYIRKISVKADYEGKTFFDQLIRENFEKLYSEAMNLSGLTEDDKRNRQQVMDILGYDPFKDESMSIRPQLYRDLVGMLSDNMRRDIAKQKAALSVVRSYANIEKYQKICNDLMSGPDAADPETQEKITDYLNLISKIQTSINQTCEKNNFTVKGIGSNGRGMLSDVMNQIEERGIDSGVTNFYDIATSKSIGEISDISWRSMLNQVALTKLDMADIIADQAKYVREAQEIAMKSQEALRLAKEKITKQQLLEELEREYRKKGISEEDIEEFIKREIEMFSLSD